MQVQFILGPAGSGKTFRCLSEIRVALKASPDGLPLLLLAPKQATFQCERLLLADPELPGYTRLQILSFERLAEFVLSQLGRSTPRLLSEEGRVMVLRALLARKRDELKVFRSTARLPGFAQQLSQPRELQRHQLGPAHLARLASDTNLPAALREKFNDLDLLLRAYLNWLHQHELEDAARLLDLAAAALRSQGSQAHTGRLKAGSVEVTRHEIEGGAADDSTNDDRVASWITDQPATRLGGLWLDGFAEMTPQELDLLAALVSCCEKATLAFCLEREPLDETSWLSTWAVVSQTFRQCYQRLASLPGAEISIETLERQPDRSRFADSPALQLLERYWTEPQSTDASGPRAQANAVASQLRPVICPDREAEAAVAAREILRFVRSGGRYRDCAVLVRAMEDYHDVVRRAFTQYGIPFFLDRREPVTHHPLAELTRYALRTVTFNWQRADWFGALKTGLVHGDETAIDLLENEALARGWEGSVWRRLLKLPDQPALERRIEGLRQAIVPPFVQLADTLTAAGDSPRRPNGIQLSEALRVFWDTLGVERILEEWSRPVAAESSPSLSSDAHSVVHRTVWQQMNDWLDNLALAFGDESLPLAEWLPIVEAGLAELTVGVIPPSLDQVLVGAVDRSRNPELRLALVLGLNEGVFPAPPASAVLLTDADRDELEQHNVFIGSARKLRLGHERYLGYIACTRARQRLVLTCARFDGRDRTLNPSPFLDYIKQLFPSLPIEDWQPATGWRECEHISELAPLLSRSVNSESPVELPTGLMDLPAVAAVVERLRNPARAGETECLPPVLAQRLYGCELHTSVSRLEQFADCPFRFFVNSGLRAQERLRFEVDARKLGSFQHEVLQRFHEGLRAAGRSWHSLTSAEARQRVRALAQEVAAGFGEGVLLAAARDRFTVRRLSAALEDFIQTIVEWMEQYDFEPAEAELKFGPDGALPPWILPLSGDRQLVFHGVIDRVDLCPTADRECALCVVVDYKSSARQINPRLLENGVQLQLPAYLSVLRHLAEPERVFGRRRLIPTGVFYVSLRGRYERVGDRNQALEQPDLARRRAYRHTGRFDAEQLIHFDNRRVQPGQEKAGDQFSFKVTAQGRLHGSYREAMPSDDFKALLDTVEGCLREMGERIFSGDTRVDPLPGQRADAVRTV